MSQQDAAWRRAWLKEHPQPLKRKRRPTGDTPPRWQAVGALPSFDPALEFDWETAARKVLGEESARALALLALYKLEAPHAPHNPRTGA